MDRDLLIVLLNTSWQWGLVSGLVWMLAHWFIRSQAVRHALWFAALVALPLLFVLNATMPGLVLVSERAPGTLRSPSPPSASPGLQEMDRTPGGQEQTPLTPVTAKSEEQPSVMNTRLTLESGSSAASWSWRHAVLALWIAGIGWGILRLAWGATHLRRVYQLAQPAQTESQHLLEALRGRLGVRTPIQLLTSTEVGGPLSFGWWQPCIILPDGMSASQAELVLAHELAHVHRRDWLVNLLVQCVGVVFFFHPMLSLVRRGLADAREQLCDDWVVQFTGRRADYAQCLVDVLNRQTNRLSVTLALGHRRAHLVERVKSIFDEQRRLELRMSKKRASAIVGVAAAILPLLSMAQLMPLRTVRLAIGTTATQADEAVLQDGTGMTDEDGELGATFYALRFRMEPPAYPFSEIRQLFDDPPSGWDKTKKPLPLSMLLEFARDRWPDAEVVFAVTRSTRISPSLEGRVVFDHAELGDRLIVRWIPQADGGLKTWTPMGHTTKTRAFPQPGIGSSFMGGHGQDLHDIHMVLYTAADPHWPTIHDESLYSVDGQVRLPRGTSGGVPASGVLVKAIWESSSRYEWESLTDAQGRFEFSYLEPGRYRLILSGSHPALPYLETFELTEEQQESLHLQVQLEEPGMFRGNVVFPEDMLPPANPVVLLAPAALEDVGRGYLTYLEQNLEEMELDPHQHVAELDEDGNFQIQGIRPGNYQTVVWNASIRPRQDALMLPLAATIASNTETLMTLYVPRRVRLEVKVIDAATGIGISDAGVQATIDDTEFMRQVRPGENGVYEVLDLIAGVPARIGVHHREYAMQEAMCTVTAHGSLQLKPNTPTVIRENNTMLVRLSPGAKVSGRVIGENLDRVHLYWKEFMGWPRMQPDGTFTHAHTPPGRYTLVLARRKMGRERGSDVLKERVIEVSDKGEVVGIEFHLE